MPNQPKTPARAIRISDEVWAALQAIGDKHDMSTSDVVRLAISDFLAERNPWDAR